MAGSPVAFATDPALAPSSIVVADGRLSASLVDYPLSELLGTLSELTGLAVVNHAPPETLLTVEVQRATLAELLQKALPADGYLLVQPALQGDAGSPAAVRLWVFPASAPVAPMRLEILESMLLFGTIPERKAAIRALRELGTADAIATLSLALADEQDSVRDVAISALADIGTDEALAAVASAAADADPWLRGKAAAALGEGPIESAVQYLKLVIADPDPRVRIAAVESFADLPLQRAAGVLSNALRDPDPAVREAAADALEEIDDDIAFRALIGARP